MIEDNAKSGSTVGGDKNYDTVDFVAGCRERGCTPHVSQNDTNRRSAIDARTTRHLGYHIRIQSQNCVFQQPVLEGESRRHFPSGAGDHNKVAPLIAGALSRSQNLALPRHSRGRREQQAQGRGVIPGAQELVVPAT
jgi:hypothetical protein